MLEKASSTVNPKLAIVPFFFYFNCTMRNENKTAHLMCMYSQPLKKNYMSAAPVNQCLHPQKVWASRGIYTGGVQSKPFLQHYLSFQTPTPGCKKRSTIYQPSPLVHTHTEQLSYPNLQATHLTKHLLRENNNMGQCPILICMHIQTKCYKILIN